MFKSQLIRIISPEVENCFLVEAEKIRSFLAVSIDLPDFISFRILVKIVAVFVLLIPFPIRLLYIRIFKSVVCGVKTAYQIQAVAKPEQPVVPRRYFDEPKKCDAFFLTALRF